MTTKNISLLGATYSNVPGVTLPVSGGGSATFYEISDTTAAASDVATGKYFYTSAGVKTEGTNSGGGGGGATLLKTQSLGALNVTSTSETNLNISVTVNSINDYDLLIVIAIASSKTAGQHVATHRIIKLNGKDADFTQKTSAVLSQTYNYRITLGNVFRGSGYSTSYGIYPASTSFSNGNISFSMMGRKNNTYTFDIDDTYTLYVYGMSIYDSYIAPKFG